MSYTTLDLLSSVKVRAMFPDASTGSLSSASLLNLATEELHSSLVPMIMSVREKYYETYQDTAMAAAQAIYPIPTRAIGGVLSVVQYILNNYVMNLQPIDPNAITTTDSGLTPRGFYFQNNNIVLYPTPNVTQGTIRMRYYQRPSRLEQTINCAQITSFDTNALTATCSAVPSTWANGTVVDFIPAVIPYQPYGLNSVISGVTSGVITFSALPTTSSNGAAVLTAGDWIALAEYTPIPEVPFEFFAALAQATACKGLEAIGDQQNLGIAEQKLEAYLQSALKLVTPRDQNGTKKVVSAWRTW